MRSTEEGYHRLGKRGETPLVYEAGLRRKETGVAETSGPSREQERDALLQRALENPGVSELIEAYKNAERYQVTAVVQRPKVRYDTSSNR